MTTWFTSDLHFFHKGIIPLTERKNWPCIAMADSVEQKVIAMDEELVSRWNTRVKPDDIVYMLGDVSFRGVTATSEILEQLQGRKTLVYGNHDRKHINKDEFIRHWDLITPYHELRIDGQMIVLMHYPLAVWNHMHRGSWMLHGHSHGNYSALGKIMDVGIDSKHTRGMPVSLLHVTAHMKYREFNQVDHHV